MFKFVIHTRHSLARAREYGGAVRKIESDIFMSNEVYQLWSWKLMIIWSFFDYVIDKCGRIITILRKNRSPINERIDYKLTQKAQDTITFYQVESYNMQKEKYQNVKW